MAIYYPAPLKAGSTIAISAISSGIDAALWPRFENAIAYLKQHNFNVIEGAHCRTNHNHVSTSAQNRADELMAFLYDDNIDAIMPPWGGEFSIELLPLMDFDKLSKVKPKWLIGFSDISTLACALTSKLGWATCHATNLMQLNESQSDELTTSVFTHLSLSRDASFTQFAAPFYESHSADFAQNPDAAFNLDNPSQWRVLNTTSDVSFSGRLNGGCLDTLIHLFNSPYCNTENLLHDNRGIILYLENAELQPTNYFRALFSLKLNGMLDSCNGILIGRNSANTTHSKQIDHIKAMKNALSDLSLPVIYNMDIGHQAPNLTLLNSSYCEVRLTSDEQSITQFLI